MNLFPFVSPPPTTTIATTADPPFLLEGDGTSRDLLLNLALKGQEEADRGKNAREGRGEKYWGGEKGRKRENAERSGEQREKRGASINGGGRRRGG